MTPAQRDARHRKWLRKFENGRTPRGYIFDSHDPKSPGYIKRPRDAEQLARGLLPDA